MVTSEADYIIVGGGLTGCAVASRLKQGNPSLDVLILEAGVDPAGDPNTTSFAGTFDLLDSDLDWAYTTVPQTNIQNRVHTIHAGKALGGGSVINLGGWARGNASDYDQWAKTVGDDRWSYKFGNPNTSLIPLLILNSIVLMVLSTSHQSLPATLNVNTPYGTPSGLHGRSSVSNTILIPAQGRQPGSVSF